MAHAALLHLMQLLEEELIQFSCRVLKIEGEKARAFHLKANEFVHNLDDPQILKHVMDLIKEVEPLSLTIQEYLMDAARSLEVIGDSPQIEEGMFLLELMNSSLRHSM